MMILDLVFGLLLVFAGRNAFWLCVGIVGFLIGMQFSASWGFLNGGMALFSSFIIGCAFALLAISFEWFSVVFGVGFLGGGYLLMNIFSPTAQHDPYSWSIFVVGGIVGMCLMIIVFDLALIIISSLLGATLIVNSFDIAEGLRVVFFTVCFATGVVVQYQSLSGRQGG